MHIRKSNFFCHQNKSPPGPSCIFLILSPVSPLRVTLSRWLPVIVFKENIPTKESVETLGMNNNRVNKNCEDEGKKREYCETEKITREISEKNHSTPPTSHHKRFGCTYSGCRRTYTTVGNLKTHLKTHSGEYNFQCTFKGCSKTFQSSYNLKIHLRVHTGEKPYYCKEKGCEKVFSSLYRLKIHQRVHSGKTFDCKFESCEKAFTTVKDLRRHERTHTGERPFLCKVEGCGSAFTVSHHLKDHLRTHAGDRPFSCYEAGCVKAFSTRSQLKTHLKTHNREKLQFFETESLDLYGVQKTTSETEVANKLCLPLEERTAESRSVREIDKTVITQQQNTNSSELNTDADGKDSSSPLEVARTSLKNSKQTMPASQSRNNIELSKNLLVGSIGTSDSERCKDLKANQTNMEATPEQRLPNILGICSLSSSNQNSKPYAWQPVDPYEESIVTSTATLLNPAKIFPQPLPKVLSSDFSSSSVTLPSGIALPMSDLSSGNIISPKCVLPEVSTAETFSVNPSLLLLSALPRPVYPGCYPFIPFPNLFTPPLLSQLPIQIQQGPESSIVVRDNTLVVVSGAEEFPLTSADNSVICSE